MKTREIGKVYIYKIFFDKEKEKKLEKGTAVVEKKTRKRRRKE